MAKWIKCDPVTRANCPDRKTCGQPGEDVMFLEGSDCDKFSQKVRIAQTTMRLIALDDKRELALKAVVYGCNTNKRLAGASFMTGIDSGSPETISFYDALSVIDEMMDDTIEAELRWIPVTERLPERDEKCLCRYTFGEKELMCFYQVLDYYATDPQPHFQHTLGDSKMRVTHWMPLPEQPKMEGDST